MSRPLTAKAMLELGRLRQRLRQVEEDLGLVRVSPSAPLLSRFGVTGEVEELVGEDPVGFLSIHAANGDYLFAGQASESLFGWRPEELVGQSAYVFFHEEDLPRLAEDHAAHLSERGELQVIRYRLRQSDDSYSLVETRSRAIAGDNGVEQIICITRPIDGSLGKV